MVLHSELSKEGIAEDIQTYLKENSVGDTQDIMTWDALKATIRGSLISRTTYLKKLCAQESQSILDNIKKLEFLALDFEKAFDSVEFRYILYLLQHMNFGRNFITAMKEIYNKPTARIRLNNSTSNRIPINRGMRQGCPLSPLFPPMCGTSG